MPADANDPPTRPKLERKRIKVGSYVLVVGDPAGMEIKAATGQAATAQAKPRELEQAIAQADAEPEPPHTGVDRLAGAVDDAAEVTSKIELALSLFTQILEGSLDPTTIDGVVEALLDLLGRLDREGRWEEALRLARALVKLLMLLERWLQLLQSLRTALRAAKRFADVDGQAWALHEQGTLCLAAEKHADAASLLSEAHDLRFELDDTHDLAVTDHNLQVLCKTLRARVQHPPRSWLEWILQRPVAALMLAVSMLLLGGVAGALIGGSGGAPPITVTTTITKPPPPVPKASSISLVCPAGPVQLGERVSISGTLRPAQAGETITIAYTTPSSASKSETQKTKGDGAYRAVASADESGLWHVASSWPGNAKYKKALGICAFQVGGRPRPNEPVSITANPTNASVEAGQEVSFTATASGIPAPTVQWEESRERGGAFSPIPGATKTTWTVEAVATADSGRQYRAVFTNSSGSQTSEVATLTVSTPGTVTSE